MRKRSPEQLEIRRREDGNFAILDDRGNPKFVFKDGKPTRHRKRGSFKKLIRLTPRGLKVIGHAKSKTSGQKEDCRSQK